MIFLRYSAEVKGYKFFDPQSRRIVIVSSTIFNEFSFLKCSDGEDEPDLIISKDDNNLETEDHQDQEEENSEDTHENPPMDITFDQDLLPNLDPHLEQQLETPLFKTPSPPPTTPGGIPKEYQHFPPISSPQRPQLRHLPPMSPRAPARPPPPEVPLRRSQRISRPRFDPDNAYGQRRPVEIKRSIIEHTKEDDPFLMVNEIGAKEISAHFMKALLSIGTPVFDVLRQYSDIFKLSKSQQKQWLDACEEEMKSMKEREVWDLTDLSPNWKPITERWIFVKKNNGRIKAQFIAKGFTQVFGIDFEETFSPVARFKTV